MTNRFDYQGTGKQAPYFEGWYIKSSDAEQDFTLALIPGLAKFSTNECFIQYNLFYKGKRLSGKVTYSLDEFDVIKEPYSILMPKFVLSEKGVKAHITDDTNDLLVDLNFGELMPLNQNLYAPSIMGPFEYLKMPCSHDVVSMRHDVTGMVVINGEKVTINAGRGYIEKDRGSTFPSKYVWAQSNQFSENDKSALFLSVADIDLKVINFTGTIAIFFDGVKEHWFATYLGTKAEVTVGDDDLSYTVTLTNKEKSLVVKVSLINGNKLIAPMNEKMDYAIKETVKANMDVVFIEKNKSPLSLTTKNGAAEKVNWE